MITARNTEQKGQQMLQSKVSSNALTKWKGLGQEFELMVARGGLEPPRGRTPKAY